VKKSLNLFLLLISCFLFPAKLSATPIIGTRAPTLVRQGIMSKLHIMYMNFTHYWANEEWIEFGEDSSYTAILSLAEVHYGFEKPLTVRAIFPVAYQQQDFGESESSVGIGDIIVDLKYNIYDPSKKLGYAGILYPTFSALVGARFPAGGDTLFPIRKWLGMGSTDLKIGGLIRLGNGIGAFNLGLSYWFNGLLGDDTDDETFYNVGIETPYIFNKLSVILELDGSKEEGENYILQFCPGLQYRIQYGRGERLRRRVEHEVLIEASFPIPIKAEGGFKYSFAPFMGVSWYF